MNSRESERSSSFAPTDRQGPKWPLHPRATGSGAPRSVPKCRQKRNVPICRLEGTEEDGVGSGFAELELVAGIELGGTAGLDLNADARGPVYHHGSVGGRQVLDVPGILVIAPHVGMASRNVIAHIGDIALPRPPAHQSPRPARSAESSAGHLPRYRFARAAVPADAPAPPRARP